MSDPPAAIAKIAELTFVSAEKLGTPLGLGQVLARAYFIDRTEGAGFLADQVQRFIGLLTSGLEVLGYPVKHTPEYVWYLVCRYGKMSSEATSPSKLEIIQAAFFSEFSETFANEADAAMFRDLVEKLDYNEALFLAGLWAFSKDLPPADRMIRRVPAHTDYHIARSLASKGELFVVVVDAKQRQVRDNFSAAVYASDVFEIRIAVTPALARFVDFVGRTETLPISPGV